jgi:hypothetical protein
MEIKNFKVKTEEYFEAFKNKDISLLNEFYSNDIHLIDWEVNVKGKQEVLNVNSNLFKENFELKLIDMVQSDNVTINTIFIEIPKHNIGIEVIDIITFNKETFEIEKIRAYKG